MSGVTAIAKRELGVLLRTPVGWVASALFAALTAITFALGVLIPGEPASLRAFFAVSHWLLLVVSPAISMRLLAEERRAGTIDVLMVSPISDWAIAVGKFAGAWCSLAVLLTPTLVYVAVLYAVSSPDPGPIISGYLGLALVGALYLAVGLAMSSLTDSQVVAFLTTFFFFVSLWFASSTLAPMLGGWPADAIVHLSIGRRIGEFAKGVIAAEHIVFFVATSAWFVSLTAVRLEMRRWR